MSSSVFNQAPVTVIAEAGVNHNGDLAIAKQLIDVAATAGANFVKFQTFKAEKIVSTSARKADYQLQNDAKGEATQLAMLKKLELDQSMHQELIKHAHQQGIQFLSTPFDPESVDLLDALGISVFKIPSGEITNAPLIEKIGRLCKPVILSSGMATLGEIEEALFVLLNSGLLRDQITVLHCNTEYPTPITDVNLRAMQTIGAALKVPVGYSDHTLGLEIPIAATALGATIIEKHFTLDRTMDGPDHRASLEPDELNQMVRAIRHVSLALGSGIKQPSPSEAKNSTVARKSIHLSTNLPTGHLLRTEDLIMKRPGNGISPMHYAQVVGRIIRQPLPTDHQLQWKDIE